MTEANAEPIAALIWCPFPDRDSARHSAKCLLDEGLVACANIFAGVESLFSWNNEVNEALETGVLFKTNQAKLERTIARLAELHPYEEPAIVGWNCDAESIGTANWLMGLGV